MDAGFDGHESTIMPVAFPKTGLLPRIRQIQGVPGEQVQSDPHRGPIIQTDGGEDRGAPVSSTP